MPRRNEDRLACRELPALCKGFVQAFSAITAVQPIPHQVGLRGVMQLQQIGQRRQRVCSGGRCAKHRVVEGELGGRSIARQAGGQFQARHFQRAQALAQGGFQRVLPAWPHMQAAPQGLQLVQPMFGKPGLELAIGSYFLLQGLERIEPGRKCRLP